MTDYPGIDYGLGQTNIDTENGIRFGVIPANDVQWWYDSAESEYGPPHCPKCGRQADTLDAFGESFTDGIPDDYTEERYECTEYVCVDCKHCFGGESAFGDDPIGWYVADAEYHAHQYHDDCDIVITKSPYFTRAQFCSPCAPGAAHLGNPCNDGPRAYCFGVDWFDSDRPCQYPVYRVDEIDPVTGADGPARYTPSIETDDGE